MWDERVSDAKLLDWETGNMSSPVMHAVRLLVPLYLHLPPPAQGCES